MYLWRRSAYLSSVLLGITLDGGGHSLRATLGQTGLKAGQKLAYVFMTQPVTLLCSCTPANGEGNVHDEPYYLLFHVKTVIKHIKCIIGEEYLSRVSSLS